MIADPSDGVVFRRALPEEHPRLISMAVEIFSGEQEIPAELIGQFAGEPVFWCAEEDGRPCAAVAAWQENGETHMGRFIVDPALRGRHIGSRLVRFAFRDVFDHGAEQIRMDCRDITVRIVSALGARITGDAQPFYLGNTTPMTLTRADFEAACASR